MTAKSIFTIPTVTLPPFPLSFPSLAALGITPTVTEFIDASMAVCTTYLNSITGALTMGDLTPFTVNGSAVISEDLSTGLLATAYFTPLHQVIVAFEATVGITTTGYTQAFENAQLNADVIEGTGSVAENEVEAAQFAQSIVADAQAQGICAANVFVTGDSLGAIEAEYTAQQTGLAGIGFEPTGIPVSSSAKGNGGNFVDVVTYGDPVANLASDIDAEQPLAPAYVAGGGSLPHYGQELFVGNPADESVIGTDLAPYDSGIEAAKANGTEAAYFSSLIGTFLQLASPYHTPLTTAYDLGTGLPVLTALDTALNAPGVTDGNVLHVGNDTLPQLLAYIAATHGNTVSSPLASTSILTDTSTVLAA